MSSEIQSNIAIVGFALTVLLFVYHSCSPPNTPKRFVSITCILAYCLFFIIYYSSQTQVLGNCRFVLALTNSVFILHQLSIHAYFIYQSPLSHERSMKWMKGFIVCSIVCMIVLFPLFMNAEIDPDNSVCFDTHSFGWMFDAIIVFFWPCMLVVLRCFNSPCMLGRMYDECVSILRPATFLAYCLLIFAYGTTMSVLAFTYTDADYTSVLGVMIQSSMEIQLLTMFLTENIYVWAAGSPSCYCVCDPRAQEILAAQHVDVESSDTNSIRSDTSSLPPSRIVSKVNGSTYDVAIATHNEVRPEILQLSVPIMRIYSSNSEDLPPHIHLNMFQPEVTSGDVIQEARLEPNPTPPFSPRSPSPLASPVYPNVLL